MSGDNSTMRGGFKALPYCWPKQPQSVYESISSWALELWFLSSSQCAGGELPQKCRIFLKDLFCTSSSRRLEKFRCEFNKPVLQCATEKGLNFSNWHWRTLKIIFCCRAFQNSTDKWADRTKQTRIWTVHRADCLMCKRGNNLVLAGDGGGAPVALGP